MHMYMYMSIQHHSSETVITYYQEIQGAVKKQRLLDRNYK